MTVIGYIRTCRQCLLTMLVTVEGRDQTLCPRCLDDSIAQAIEKAIAEADGFEDFLPPEQVQG